MLIFVVSTKASTARNNKNLQKLGSKHNVHVISMKPNQVTTRRERLLLRTRAPRKWIVLDPGQRLKAAMREQGKPDMIIALGSSNTKFVWDFVRLNPTIPAVYGMRAGIGMAQYLTDGKKF